MATPEEKRNKNLREANELLSESIDLAGTLSDQMSFAYKKSQEKYFQDKQSVDLTKKLVDFTKNLSSQYTSIKDIEKDIAKNKKIQNEIARQQISLEKTIGQEGKDRIAQIKEQEQLEKSLTEQLEKAREEEAAGVRGAKQRANSLAQQVMSARNLNQEYLEALSSEERQYMLLEQTGDVIQRNNDYLNEQKRRQENINKGMGLFGRAAEGAQKTLEKIGAGEFGKALGLDAAAAKAKEMSEKLTDGGKKSLGFFGKLRVATASFGAALKSALGPIALIGLIVDAYNKGKESAQRLNEENVELSRYLGVSQKTANMLMVDIRGIGSAMGITGAMAAQSASSIYSALDGAEKLSKKTLETFMKLNVF